MGKKTTVEPAKEPGPGVRSLLQGSHPTVASQPTEASQKPTEVVQQAAEPAPAANATPSWYFFGLDLMFLAIALGIAWPNPGHLGWKGWLVCVALVLAGGACSILGIWNRSE